MVIRIELGGLRMIQKTLLKGLEELEIGRRTVARNNNNNIKYPIKSYCLQRKPCKPREWNWQQEDKT